MRFSFWRGTGPALYQLPNQEHLVASASNVRLIGSHGNVTFRYPSLEGPREDHGRNKKNNEPATLLVNFMELTTSFDDFTTGVVHQRS